MRRTFQLLFKFQLLLFLVIAVSPGVAQNPSPQRYPIKLDIPDRVKERYHVDASATQRRIVTTTFPGQFAQTTTDEFAIELGADVLIEAVEKDVATRKRFTIVNSKITKGGSSRALLPEGSVVVASKDKDRTVFHVNEKPVDEQTTTWLLSLIALHTAGVGDDGMFGTTTPRAVGESWSISIDEIKKLLKEMGASGSGEIAGSGTLEKAEANHIFVRGRVGVKNVLLALGEKFTPQDGNIEAHYFGRVPLSGSDTSRGVVGDFHLTATGIRTEEAGFIKVEYVMDSRSQYEITPLDEVTKPKN
jgi:hypothetical protein